MPIYIQIKDLKGSISGGDHDRPIESGASGGVWKTTNFLTTDSNGPTYISRISFANGGGSVDAQEALPTRKAAELFERAGSAPNGKLYVATNVGVFNKDPIAGKTRLIFGDDQGVFSKPGMGVLKSSDGGRTWTMKKVPVVELIVSDRGSASGRTFRLNDVTIAPGPRGMIELNYSSVEF